MKLPRTVSSTIITALPVLPAFAWTGGMDAGELLAVADGSDVWIYLSNQHTFKRQKGGPSFSGEHEDDDSIDNPQTFARGLWIDIAIFSVCSRLNRTATLVKEEVIQLSDQSFPCYVQHPPGPDHESI